MSRLRKRWKPAVLWELSHGRQRFSQLQNRIPQVAHKVLIDTLRELEADGLVSREQIPSRHVEYALTELGESLRPILSLMDRWGRTQAPRRD